MKIKINCCHPKKWVVMSLPISLIKVKTWLKLVVSIALVLTYFPYLLLLLRVPNMVNGYLWFYCRKLTSHHRMKVNMITSLSSPSCATPRIERPRFSISSTCFCHPFGTNGHLTKINKSSSKYFPIHVHMDHSTWFSINSKQIKPWMPYTPYAHMT